MNNATETETTETETCKLDLCKEEIRFEEEEGWPTHCLYCGTPTGLD